MKRKNSILFTALFLTGLLSAGAALAERPAGDWHHGPPDAVGQLARLDRALDLSDEQSTQLLEVLLASQAEREALHAQIMESLGPEICALRESTEAEILAILTPEQAAAFQQMTQERAGRRHARHDPPALDCSGQDG
jgi:Spy/CpxP family protein refolding chaperone